MLFYDFLHSFFLVLFFAAGSEFADRDNHCFGSSLCLGAGSLEFIRYFLCCTIPKFSPCLRWPLLNEFCIVYQALQLFPIPGEDLRCVFILYFTGFKLIFFEQIVDGLIATAPFSDILQLIVVPVLAQYLLRHRRLSIKEIDDLICTFLANKSSKEDNCVRALIHFTVDAPFIVRFLQKLNQIICELRIDR